MGSLKKYNYLSNQQRMMVRSARKSQYNPSTTFDAENLNLSKTTQLKNITSSRNTYTDFKRTPSSSQWLYESYLSRQLTNDTTKLPVERQRVRNPQERKHNCANILEGRSGNKEGSKKDSHNLVQKNEVLQQKKKLEKKIEELQKVNSDITASTEDRFKTFQVNLKKVQNVISQKEKIIEELNKKCINYQIKNKKLLKGIQEKSQQFKWAVEQIQILQQTNAQKNKIINQLKFKITKIQSELNEITIRILDQSNITQEQNKMKEQMENSKRTFACIETQTQIQFKDQNDKLMELTGNNELSSSDSSENNTQTQINIDFDDIDSSLSQISVSTKMACKQMQQQLSSPWKRQLKRAKQVYEYAYHLKQQVFDSEISVQNPKQELYFQKFLNKIEKTQKGSP